MKIIVTMISVFNYKFAFIPLLSFRKNQNQESNLQKVGGVVRRNVSALYL